MLFNDKVLLALSHHSEFDQTVPKGVDITTTFYGLFIIVMDRLGRDKMDMF